MNPNTLAKEVLVLTNSEIESLVAMRETQKALRDRLTLMDQAVGDAEEKIIAKVQQGCDLSRCSYAVSISEVSRRYPSWKEEFISRLGKKEADALLAGTTPTTHLKLVIV